MLSFTGQEKVARLLIHNGADFTLENKQGKTASNVAAEKGIFIQPILIFWRSIELSIACNFSGFTDLAHALRENIAQKGDHFSLKAHFFYSLTAFILFETL